MKRLRLFTVFHGNLDFSAIPDRDLPRVIASCYWPLLALAERERVPLGIEMPAHTLRRIAEEDPEWLKSFRELAERGLVEPVASGWGQLIGPLVPVDVNRRNLALGRDAYADVLGHVPRTWFVAEQTFAAGLAEFYREVGAERLVMEWNNPARERRELRPLRHLPARLRAGDGPPLALLWNDCVVFQKLQRVAHGQLAPRDYLGAVASALRPDREGLLCAYGGDVEIFDYRPGACAPAGAGRGVEMARLVACLAALAADSRFEFRLPREAGAGLAEGPLVDLTCAADPIPCKKQPRYNPTRWAVSGRDGIGMNTRCFALRRTLRASSGLHDGAASDARTAALERTLVDLWGSDFRTRATEEKVDAFHTRMGAALSAARAQLARGAPLLREGEDVVLWNPSAEPWSGYPVEVPLRLPPGRLRQAVAVSTPPDALEAEGAQLEVQGRYRDGSVRRATLVLEPTLAPGERVALRLVPQAVALPPGTEHPSRELARTEAVEAAFLPQRGGALGWLRFPGLRDAPLLGTIPHGSFEDVAWTPDFYSGHVIALCEDGSKVTDLVPAERVFLASSGPVRTTLGFQVRTPLGEWTKLYRLYRRRPRLDLVHGLHFQEARLASLRLGVLTWLPDAWARDTLGYASVNGGAVPDVFPLQPGVVVAHPRAVSPAITASSCLGATEGWVSAGDARCGVAVLSERSQWAVAPLLEYTDVDDRWFLRVQHSAAESDETRATFLRGVRRVGFAVVGHDGDLEGVRRAARAIEGGLVYRTERSVGIARGV